MTENCTRSITPDSITGMIFAAEGIDHVVTLLNGPMGCKFYHSTTSQFLAVRPPLYLPSGEEGKKVPVNYQYLDNWFFRQSRVPCTWLDGEDYIYGTADQVRDALIYIRENLSLDLMVIVNSPGASLIGDSLPELVYSLMPDVPSVVMESPGYSESFGEGYQSFGLALFRQAGERIWREDRDHPGTLSDAAVRGAGKKVNILGFSLWQRYAEGDKEEIIRILREMGVGVNCCLFCGCSMEEIRQLPEADLNLVFFPERSLDLAEELKTRFGTPYYRPETLPVGFDATEKFIEKLQSLLNLPDTGRSVLEECRRARARAFAGIRGIHEISGLPEGCRFSIEGNASEVLALGTFLTEYLGMIPDVLAVTEGKLEEEEKVRLGGEIPFRKPMEETGAELIFGNANTIALLKSRREAFCGIEISHPGMGYTDLIPKTQMGIRGSLFLTEQVLNGLMSRSI